MNKIALDALNAGWSLGFATRIQPKNDDLAQLVAYKASIEPQPEPVAVASGTGRFARFVEMAKAALFSAAHQVAH